MFFGNLKVLVLLLVSYSKIVYSENILYVATMASPSHHIWNSALAVGLANKGYNVTHIGPDRDKLPKPHNYTHILIEDIYTKLYNTKDINEMASYGPARMMIEFEEWCMLQCKLSLRTKGLQTLLNYPNDFKFDIIIYDVTAGSCLYPLIHRFKYPPSVAVSAFLLPQFVSDSFGNSLFPSYIPWYGLPYTTEMNFFERVWNFIYTYVDINLRHIYQYRGEHTEAQKVFGTDIPSMEHLERHFSLALANTDPLLDHPQPIPPNIIPVGGLHTRKSKEIPQDLQNIVNNATNGVIVMSLGTNIRSDKLPKNTQKAILDAFGKLSETVIWKFESDVEDIPENVILRKWLPQNDILGHPKVKLFIGHGGALSTQEAVFHGVPVIVIPFIIDQYIASRTIVNKKLGVQVDFRNITSEYFLTKIREVLDNPAYDNNMKILSALFKDRAETPLERGIFWIEYVMRHGGAHFLNLPARDLHLFKRASFDVILFLLAIGYVFIVIIFKILSVMFNKFSKNKKLKMQ